MNKITLLIILTVWISDSEDSEIDNYERSANGAIPTLGQNTIHNLPQDFDENDIAIPQDRCFLEKDVSIFLSNHTLKVGYFPTFLLLCNIF